MVISGFDVFFGLIQQFGICNGLNEVYQLLWRLTTCGFGRRNSLCEFSSLNSFLMTADSQLLVDFEFWPCFPVQGAEGSTYRNH